MNPSQSHTTGAAITALHPRSIGALPLLFPILSKLQVRSIVNRQVPSEADIDLGRVVLLLVLNRLMAPQPLYQVSDWFEQTVLPEGLGILPSQVYDNRLGRALDRLHPHLGELWASLVEQAVVQYQIDLNILHWDITSLYFEGAYEDSQLVSYGYSRDHRPDTKQINLEVDVSHDGYIPVLYQVLSGQTADITRPLAHLEGLLRFLERPEMSEARFRPLLISDCKMITPEAVWACHDRHLYYLGPLADSKATQAVLSSVTAQELIAHELGYRPKRVKANDARFVPYQGVWRTYVFEYGGERFVDRALVVWSAGKQRLDEQKRKTYLKRLLNGLESIQKRLNQRRYKRKVYVEQRLGKLREGNPAWGLVDVTLSGVDGQLQFNFRINRVQLAAAQALDGRYVLATNAAHLDADQVLTLFKGQDGVEKRFRTVKGPLLVRPLFVRSDQRIEGLVWITLLALLVRAILERSCVQHDLALTANRLLEGFANLQAVDIVWQDGSMQRHAAEMTLFQTQVLGALGCPTPDTYASMTPFLR